jgi:uncharacterized protein (TIGR02270 family)
VTFAALANLDDRINRLVIALSERGLAERLLATDHDAFAAGHAFVTAAVALRSGAEDVFDELVRRLEDRDELLPPLASALAWFEYDEVSRYVKHLLGSPVAPALRLGLLAAVSHRFDPGRALEVALDAQDLTLRATGLEAAGRLGAVDLGARLRALLQDEDDACRFWAAWSVVRLGDRSGIRVLGPFAVGTGPFARPACDLALRALEADEAVSAQGRFAAAASDKRLGVLAAGIVGEPTLVPWLFAQMDTPLLARHAGAAFCLMTGRDLRRDDLDGSPLEPAPPDVAVDAPPAASGTDAETTAEPDAEARVDELEHLAWPDPGSVRQWWAKNGQAFKPGVRYLAGLPIRRPELTNVLRNGNQTQRAAAALELALLDPSAPLLDVAGPTQRQGRTAVDSG